MQFDLLPYNKPFNLILSIRISRPISFRLWVYDKERDTCYIDRRFDLGKSTRVRFKLPITPEKLRVHIIDTALPIGDKSFFIEEIHVSPDTKCPVNLSEDDKDFIAFAAWLARGLSSLETGEKGTFYRSGGFTVLLKDVITDNGEKLTTPARIGQRSKIIEVSKSVMKNYTVPMVILVLLHEYAHQYKNPEYGRKVSNEMSADLIALNMALNLGFDSKEAENCFDAVF